MSDQAATDAGREGRVLTGCSHCFARLLDRAATDVRRGGYRVTETVRPVVFRTDIRPDTEEDGAVPGGPAPSVLALLLSWRNWNIPTKLTAVTLVPVVFAIVLGAM